MKTKQILILATVNYDPAMESDVDSQIVESMQRGLAEQAARFKGTEVVAARITNGELKPGYGKSEFIGENVEDGQILYAELKGTVVG